MRKQPVITPLAEAFVVLSAAGVYVDFKGRLTKDILWAKLHQYMIDATMVANLQSAKTGQPYYVDTIAISRVEGTT